MIAGVGIDIIEVERVGEKIRKDTGFKEKIFSPLEIVFCDSKAQSDLHYAARFAAKEAFLKATGQGLALGVELSDVEVCVDEQGKPFIKLSGNFAILAGQNNWNKIHVSLSHIKSTACAVVIIEQ
jgi:holo-[acyl-carrier protein] synthase